jgi:hypothetical protein
MPCSKTERLTSALLRKVLRFGRNNTSLKSNLISLIILGIMNQSTATPTPYLRSLQPSTHDTNCTGTTDEVASYTAYQHRDRC